uniref:Uncharacterized protein n=1 Tax=Glossina austeni TaxID=7395 RepID=A0A1A9VG87_GLOAU
MTESELKLKRQMKYLGRHRDWYLRSLGNFLQMGFPPNHFTHVLIDNASQCTETECDCCSSPARNYPSRKSENRTSLVSFFESIVEDSHMTIWDTYVDSRSSYSYPKTSLHIRHTEIVTSF